MTGMVEPTISARAKPSQNGLNLDLLELSWAKSSNLLPLKPN
jgi:hypothetical protein